MWARRAASFARQSRSVPEAPAPATVAFETLGCRLNQADTAELQAAFEARGYRTAAPGQPAGVYVVNTCTVTARAEFSDRQAIRRAADRHPGALVVVTGCWAQTSPGVVAGLPGVDLVVGTRDRHRIPALVGSLRRDAGPVIAVSDVFAPGPEAPAPAQRGPAPGRTRAFVKVQDGCQHRCSFCIVPFARGGSRSRPLDQVVGQVAGLAAAGHAEVVLTGVDLGHYGWDLAPRLTLAALVRRLLDIPGLGWLRLSSVLPAYLTDELVETMAADRRVCRHLHVPLQSGSDRVLRAMRRPYNVRLYRERVERLTARLPGLGLGTDVITGFPGETAQEFAETEALAAELPFSYLHVFSYSDRPGTEGARLPAPRVPSPEIRRRTARLRRLSAAKHLAFRRHRLGQEAEVLVLGERDRASGALLGLTGDYLEVAFPGPDALMRRLARVRLTAVEGARLSGVLAQHG